MTFRAGRLDPRVVGRIRGVVIALVVTQELLGEGVARFEEAFT
jgi:hypothetical protein